MIGYYVFLFYLSDFYKCCFGNSQPIYSLLQSCEMAVVLSLFYGGEKLRPREVK